MHGNCRKRDVHRASPQGKRFTTGIFTCGGDLDFITGSRICDDVHREYIAPFYHNAVASDYVGYHRIAESVLTKGLTHSLFAELQPMGGWNALRNDT